MARIRPLYTPEEMAEIEALQRLIWTDSETEIVPKHILLAIAQHGGITLGAFERDQLVGFVLGFLGTDLESPGRLAMSKLKHASHMLGVHPEFRNRGIGYQLKCAQREGVLSQGIRLITWTYDPLESRNAHLNIRRLGAVCSRYIENAYGELRDGLNVGLPSDRFEVDWWITSSRVRSRLEGARSPLDLAHYLDAGALKINPTRLGKDGFPHPPASNSPIQGTLFLIEIPSDISEIKAQDLELALDWRFHTRALFAESFEKGYIVTDFIYLKGEQIPRSYYVLSHGKGTLG